MRAKVCDEYDRFRRSGKELHGSAEDDASTERPSSTAVIYLSKLSMKRLFDSSCSLTVKLLGSFTMNYRVSELEMHGNGHLLSSNCPTCCSYPQLSPQVFAPIPCSPLMHTFQQRTSPVDTGNYWHGICSTAKMNDRVFATIFVVTPL